MKKICTSWQKSKVYHDKVNTIFNWCSWVQIKQNKQSAEVKRRNWRVWNMKIWKICLYMVCERDTIDIFYNFFLNCSFIFPSPFLLSFFTSLFSSSYLLLIWVELHCKSRNVFNTFSDSICVRSYSCLPQTSNYKSKNINCPW